MRTENRELVAALPLRPVLNLFANCIWFTALAAFAIVPPLFATMSAIEIAQWWSSTS